MTHTFRTHLYRQIAVVVLAVAATASALPAHAQYYGRDGYRGRPAPQYRGHDYRRGGGQWGAQKGGAQLGVVAGTVIANSVAQPPPAVIYTAAPPPPPPGEVYYDNSAPPQPQPPPPPPPSQPYQG